MAVYRKNKSDFKSELQAIGLGFEHEYYTSSSGVGLSVGLYKSLNSKARKMLWGSHFDDLFAKGLSIRALNGLVSLFNQPHNGLI